MSSPRRVALFLIAAQLTVAPLAFAQTGPGRAPAGRGGAGTAEEEEEEEEDVPPARAQGRTQPPRSNNSGQPATPPPPAGPDNRPNDFASNETEEQRDARRERMVGRFNSLNGSVGLLHMSTAEAGSDQTFRFGFMFEYFGAQGFLRPPTGTGMTMTTGDNAQHVGSTFGLSYSPIRYLDIFANVRAYANSNDMERPNLFQVLGDGQLGIKGIYPVARGFNLGLSAAVMLLNRSGDIGVALASTSADFRFLATLDLMQMTGSVPLRFHLNANYLLDNSALLVSDVETARRQRAPGYNATVCNTEQSADPMNARNVGETGRACNLEITRIERYALGINRADRFNISIGADLRVPSFPYLQPFLEWNAAVPVVRSGYICFDASTGTGDDDKCLAGNGISQFAATPSVFSIGLRALPPVRGLSATVAVDIATGGSGAPFVRELAPVSPWMFYVGAGFAHDFAPVVRRVETRVDVPREVQVDNTPPGGRLVGAVTDQESRAGVPNAILEVTGHPELGLVATNAQGRYQSGHLPPGEHEFRIHAPDYNDGTCRGTIPAPTGDVRRAPDTELNCQLRPVPRNGVLQGRVTAATGGAPVAGAIVTATPGPGITVPQGQTAPTPQTATTGADGSFNFPSMLVGTWNVAVGQTERTQGSTPRGFEVRPRETTAANITVNAANPFRITRGTINVTEQVHFQTDSAEILPDSQTLLERIADTIQRHPELTSVEIQGHTDNQGAPAHNLQLSQSRAESVRDALVRLGVPGTRLSARGFGQTRPVAPNFTAAGRARNRRVVFAITARTGGAAARPAAAPRR